MQPWRRAAVVAGLSLTEIAERTGKSYNTVLAYSRWRGAEPTTASGARRPSPEWEAAVIRLAEERMVSPAEATA